MGKSFSFFKRTIELKETIRVFNIWLLIIIAFLVLRFFIHSSKAPPHQTLVSIWVRMHDDFLLEHDFSRKEVKSGLQAVLSKYGFKGITHIFL